jgi:putative ABC transport system ATP-binding protein
MFRLQDVTKIYSKRGQTVVALETGTLEIRAGSYLAVVGPSGSGKTTLLSTLGGMLTPTSGRVWLAGRSLYELPVAERTMLRREKIGFVFQTFNLVPYLTALENVQVPMYLAGLSKRDQRAKAASLLERVGLRDRRDHKPSEMSVGQQQRVALARTLANDPALILADEPTGNLDSDNRQAVLDFLDELHQAGRTIVMVTHDPSAAQRATASLHLQHGVLTADPRTFPAEAA